MPPALTRDPWLDPKQANSTAQELEKVCIACDENTGFPIQKPHLFNIVTFCLLKRSAQLQRSSN
jgi:hypothetical protein